MNLLVRRDTKQKDQGVVYLGKLGVKTDEDVHITEPHLPVTNYQPTTPLETLSPQFWLWL
jgi:hypothetical protein